MVRNELQSFVPAVPLVPHGVAETLILWTAATVDWRSTMKARIATGILAGLLIAGACQSEGEWRPTDAEESLLRDTLVSLAEQSPAFPSGDASAMRIAWVHPEVAILIGSLRIPDEKGDTLRTTSTLVFVLTEQGWRFKSAHGM
ncbi:MAG: hypothetical protein ACYSUI_23500 [Planctomycetota bacterium]